LETKHKQKELMEPVAVIGIGCFFPKSSGLIEYWRLLSHGEDAITDVPDTHWSVDDYYDADPKKPDHIHCKRGGFLAPISFDPSEFGIPPNSLEATDTSQLLGLVAAKMAFEDAGYGENGRVFDRDRTSVILGVTGTQELVIPLSSRLGHPKWRKALQESGIPDDKAEEVVQRIADSYVPWKESSFPGLLGNVVAGRISNRLDLGGTNCVVDAACASSMSAIHLAIQELACGRSDLAVAGGVDTLNDIFMHMCFAKSSVLSASGDAKPFSRHADGTVLGEGVGIMLIKRLEDAERDGDRIYSVIRAVGSSSDGRSQSIYAPHADGQIKALRMAYENAEVSPNTVELIEAHGTGTRVGDQVEVKALKQLFGEKSPDGIRCALGSVKSMIGHTKACAGTAGLIKASLALYNKVLPPTIKVEEPDPKLNLEDSPFYLNTRIRPWVSQSGHPRRAGVSAFGFGGSNFHAVLEEYQPTKPQIAWDGSVDIAAFSAESHRQLHEDLKRWKAFVDSAASFKDISENALKIRKEFSPAHPFRLVMVLEHSPDASKEISLQAATALDRLAAKPEQKAWDAKNVYYAAGDMPGRVAFVFPGQGSQYVEMGRDLTCYFPQAFQILEAFNKRCDSSDRLTDWIYPYPVQSRQDRERQEENLRRTDRAQPAIGAASVAMFEILRMFGIQPDAVCGHSYGELTALYAAGRMDLDTFIDVSATRGRLMAAAGSDPAAPNGSMLAVSGALDDIAALVKKTGINVILANRNSPKQGILSGADADIEQADQVFRENGFRTHKLPVSAAFHSPLVKNAQKPFKEFLETVSFSPSNIPVISNTTSKPYPEDSDAARKLLADQILCPVDFIGNIRYLHDMGVRTFVEVGPKTVLTGLVRSIPADGEIHTTALDASSGSRFGVADLARCLCRLASLGYPVQLGLWERRVNRHRKQRMSIPISGTNYRSETRASDFKPTRIEPSTRNKDSEPALSVSAGSRPRQSAVPADTRDNRRQIENEVIHTQKTDNGTAMKTPVMQNDSHVISEAMKTVREGLKSMQQLQMETTEAHKKFLDAQTEAGKTLQKMMESTRHFAEVTLGHQLPSNSMRNGSSMTAESHPSVAAAETATVSDRPEAGRNVSPSVMKRAPGSSKPASDVPETTRSSAPAASTEHEAVETNRTFSNSVLSEQIREAMLTVVSELTGYPEETLDLDMDIEADLGIDSIKRVEILSTLEERMPGLPSVSPEVMGSLKTLGEILAYLKDNGASSGLSGAAAAELPADQETTQPVGDSGKIREAMLAVVSELTGYPEETLDLDMDIEADLGIDSIKRVEILSTLEERMPGLPSVSPEVMGSLKTLGEILAYLNDEGVSSAPTGDAGTPVPTDPPAARPAEDSGKIREAMLAVVSELTGYPEETLDLDMDIEADLGIDSIKRVEILSTLEERMPGLPSVSPEVMGSLKTLGQISEYLTQTGNSDSNASPVDSQEESVADSAPATEIERKRVAVVTAASETAETLKLPEGRTVFVADDDAGLSQAIVDRLSARGVNAAAVSLDSLDSDAKRSPASGLILTAPVHTGDAGSYSIDGLKNAFLRAKQLAPELIESSKQSGALLATITRLDGAFGFRAAGITDPVQGGLAGLAKTASIEWETVCCRALDISPDWEENQEIAEAVVDELLNGGPAGAVEIGLTKESRRELALVSEAYPEGEIHLDQGDVVVVTGGARGVTAAAAAALAKRVKPALVLLGRSPEPVPEPSWLAPLEHPADIKKAILQHEFQGKKVTPAKIETSYKRHMANREIARTIETIQRDAADVTYCSVDIRDADALCSVIDRVRSEHGPVRALIHGAGVLEDRLIVNKTAEQFDRVVSTKVKGLLNLLEAVREDDLGYIVLFSSVAARMGNRGQVDYAMANEVLNKVAWRESARRPDCRVISINWGPWDGGMVSPALKRKFQENGIELIPIDAGARCLIKEMSGNPAAPAEVVIGAPIKFQSGSESHPRTDADQSRQNDSAAEEPLALSFKREIDIDRYPVLESHMLSGTPVVPFALMTEWFAHGALHQNPGLVLHGLDNMRLLSGIRLDEDKKLVRLMTGKTRKQNGFYETQVEARDGIHDGREKIHYKAKAILKDRPSDPPKMDLSRYIRPKAYSRTIDEIYDDILFHGTRLRGIQEVINCSDQGMAARLVPAPSPEQWVREPLRTRWIADPLVLDSAFQMASVWCYEQTGMVSLPSYSESYRQYCRVYPNDAVTAVLQVTELTEHKMTGDYTFIDDHGNVLARITGYEAVMDPSLNEAFKPGRGQQD